MNKINKKRLNKRKNKQNRSTMAALIIGPALVFSVPVFAQLNKLEPILPSPITKHYNIKGVGILAPDDRPERINAYFEQRNMPLSGYGKQFIQAADRCDMDWRLLPAIAVIESSGGKHLMNNNPFGWGSAQIPFENFDNAIEEVGKHLCGEYPTTAKYYKDATTNEKLWHYNARIYPSYTGKITSVMNAL